MGRFQVFKKHRILGTEQDCFVSSVTKAELSGFDGTDEGTFAILQKHVHDVDEVRTLLFKSADDVESELSPGQIREMVDDILDASGANATRRFPDGEGEAGGAESPQPE